jgi:hypothetical protein
MCCRYHTPDTLEFAHRAWLLAGGGRPKDRLETVSRRHGSSVVTFPFNQAKEMAETLKGIIAYKKRLVQWAGMLFAIGTVMLAVLIVSLIWNV